MTESVSSLLVRAVQRSRLDGARTVGPGLQAAAGEVGYPRSGSCLYSSADSSLVTIPSVARPTRMSTWKAGAWVEQALP